MSWTRDKEQTLQKVREELAALEADRAHAVGQVDKVFAEITGSNHIKPEVLQTLLQRADVIRDVLSPFDSGVRAPLVSQPEPVSVPTPGYSANLTPPWVRS